jgi:ABC-type multidrug transport system fused ATPase/permease subunit
MDINDASVKTINVLFKGFYFKFILNLLYILIALVVFFIFLIPILLVMEEANATLYKTTNNNNVLVSLLLKYKLTAYNWCNLDSFNEGLSSYITYNFYTPVVIIYYASILIYFTFIIMSLHIILMGMMSLLVGIDLNDIINNDSEFKTEGSKLGFIILLFITLWISIYTAFYVLILRHIRTAVTYNNNINDFLNDTVNNKNIFPLSKKKDKEELFDDIIDRRLEPLLIMENYYTELESFQFKDSNERARFLILYVILEYVKYVNSIVDNQEYRDNVKKYLLNPLDNKDLLISFTLDNYPIKDFAISKVKPIDYLIENIFKIDLTKKEKLEIKAEYIRILNEELLDNLKKTNESLSQQKPVVYSIIILIILMVILYTIPVVYKYNYNINTIIE